MSHHVLVGCGYLGLRIGRLWRAKGDSVAVLTRKAERTEELRNEGFEPTVGDVTRPESLGGLFLSRSHIRSLVYAVGYDRAESADIGEVYSTGLASVLQIAGD